MTPAPRVAPPEVANAPRVAPTVMAHGQHGSAMLKMKSF
jgi:hypothetical protein